MLLQPVRAILNRLENKVGKHVVRREVQVFANDKRTLDLGCGRSPNADAFPNRVGVDVAPDRGVDVIADAHHLPFASGTFPQIVTSEVLEHLADPPRAAQEMSRVLLAGGRLILTMPFVYPVHEAPHDYQRFTVYGLSRLFSLADFHVEQIKPLFTEEQTLAILIQRVAFQRADPAPLHYLYLLIAHILYRLSPCLRSARYQDVNRRVNGPFMTAGYLLVAHKPGIPAKDQ